MYICGQNQPCAMIVCIMEKCKYFLWAIKTSVSFVNPSWQSLANRMVIVRSIENYAYTFQDILIAFDIDSPHMIVWCSFRILYRVAAMEIIQLKNAPTTLPSKKKFNSAESMNHNHFVYFTKLWRTSKTKTKMRKKNKTTEASDYDASTKCWPRNLSACDRLANVISRCIKLVIKFQMEWWMAIVCIVESKSHCAVHEWSTHTHAPDPSKCVYILISKERVGTFIWNENMCIQCEKGILSTYTHRRSSSWLESPTAILFGLTNDNII